MFFLFDFLSIFILGCLLCRFFSLLNFLVYVCVIIIGGGLLFLGRHGVHGVLIFFSCNLRLVFCGLSATFRAIDVLHLTLFIRILSFTLECQLDSAQI